MGKCMKFLALTAAAVILAGCQKAPVTPTAVPEPRHIDCNLIFPAPATQDTLAP